MKRTTRFALIAAAAGLAGSGALAVQPGAGHKATAQMPGIQQAKYLSPGLVVPTMDPERGKKLFASKGCVVCHSINGVGGTDAPHLDASTMKLPMNPFDFFARMWRGAVPMIHMQQEEIGHQIEFTGQDLADIVAFVHDAEVQKTFTKADIPPEIAEHMDEDSDSGQGTTGGQGTMGGQKMMNGSGTMGGQGMGGQNMGGQDMMKGSGMMGGKSN